MDAWNNMMIRNGVIHPMDYPQHLAEIELQANRMLRVHLTDALTRLEEPTERAVDAVVRFRIATAQSACARALTLMMDLPTHEALARETRINVEIQQHYQYQRQLEMQLQGLDQEGGIQDPLPLGPEWDLDYDPDEDPEEDEEEPMMIDEGPEMFQAGPEGDQVVPAGLEGAYGDGEISDGSVYPSPVHWTPPATPVYSPGPL